MEIKTIELRNLVPSEGMVLTNGIDYSDNKDGIYLGINDSADNWHEITKEEYEQILVNKQIEEMNLQAME